MKTDQWQIHKASINTWSTGVDPKSIYHYQPQIHAFHITCSTAKKSGHPSPLWKKKKWIKAGEKLMFWGASTAWWLGAWILESDVNLNSDSPVPSCMTIYSAASQWPCRDRRLLQLWPGLNENTRTVTAQCLARSRHCYCNFHCYYYCCNYYL